MKSNHLGLLLILISSSVLAQSLSPKHFEEKVYLQTDKPYYYLEENIWFSAYMSYRSSGMRDTLSRVLYVDLIGPDRNIVQSSIVRLDSGRGVGSLNLLNGL